MKNKIYIIILSLFLTPSIVFAKNITIKTNVSVEGKDLTTKEFTFNLKDKDGNIIKTEKNKDNGDVIFKNINIEDEVSQETDYIYFIEQVNEKEKGYTYDNDIIYVRVNVKPNQEPNIMYYKKNSTENMMKEKITKYDKKQSYHATEEELKGDSYAVLEIETGTIRFKRYENLDTSGFQKDFGSDNIAYDAENKIAYFRNVEIDRDMFIKALNQGYYGVLAHAVIFEEAFKPQFTDLSYVFYLNYSKLDFSHFDSSNITNMEETFKNCKCPTSKIDLSSFDTSKVTTMEKMFQNALTQEIDLTSFSAESLENMYEMFMNTDTNKLKISSKFTLTPKMKNAMYLFQGFRSEEAIDFSWFKVETDDVNLQGAFQDSSFKYLDLQNWKFKNDNSISQTFSNIAWLEYLNLSNLESDICGAYGSNDIFLNGSIKEIVLSDKYNMIYSMFNNSNIKLFNTKINDFTDELCKYDSSCRYYIGGSYIFIKDVGASFNNTYKKVEYKEIDIFENPETKNLFYLSTNIIFIVSISVFIIYRIRKQTRGVNKEI